MGALGRLLGGLGVVLEASWGIPTRHRKTDAKKKAAKSAKIGILEASWADLSKKFLGRGGVGGGGVGSLKA